MEAVEPDDGQPFRQPPAPDDRVWRHPSEVGRDSADARRPITHRTLWRVALVSALSASLLTVGLVIAVGGIGTRADRARPSAPGTDSPPVTAVETVVQIAERSEEHTSE